MKPVLGTVSACRRSEPRCARAWT